MPKFDHLKGFSQVATQIQKQDMGVQKMSKNENKLKTWGLFLQYLHQFDLVLRWNQQNASKITADKQNLRCIYKACV